MINWATLAIFSSFVFAFVAVLDKYLLAHSLPNVRIFYLTVGLIQVAMGIIILLIYPWSSNPPILTMLLAVLSGVIWGAGLMLMFFCMSKLEVSRVIPIYHTSPVFVTIMALAFLGETLSLAQGIGIILAVSGAAFIPMKPTNAPQNAGNPKLYFLVLIASILTASANVTYKYALEDISFWNLTALRSFSLGAVLIIAGYQHNLLHVVKEITKKSYLPLYMLIFAEAVLAPIAMIAMLRSLALGPVSLATTLLSTRPFFVLIISGILSTKYLNLLNEPIDRRTLPIKFVSIGLIFIGICLITLY
ncbi:MAG: EamA family transporter [Dehalococcoidia bacterium]|nr:EamA family transporter [Dehalococcoidia bacterium]